MSTPKLVEDFYQRIWNDGNLDAAAELLKPEFSFRGSLGKEMRGGEAFKNYVRSVRAALADYQCKILFCVAEAKQAFAKMCFSGRHVGLWVLGDLAGLDALLQAQASDRGERR